MSLTLNWESSSSLASQPANSASTMLYHMACPSRSNCFFNCAQEIIDKRVLKSMSCRNLYPNSSRMGRDGGYSNQGVQLRIEGHFGLRTFWTKVCNILRYGMNLKFETIVQIFRNIIQLNLVLILKSTNIYYRNIFSKSGRKMELCLAMKKIWWPVVYWQRIDPLLPWLRSTVHPLGYSNSMPGHIRNLWKIPPPPFPWTDAMKIQPSPYIPQGKRLENKSSWIQRLDDVEKWISIEMSKL